MRYGIEKVVVKSHKVAGRTLYSASALYENGDTGVIGNGEALTKSQMSACLEQEIAWHRAAKGDESTFPVLVA